MSAKKKKPIISYIRTGIQILFFILLPALYAGTFSGIKNIYLSIIKGNFDLATQGPVILEVVGMIIFTAILGRFFCGWMCSFGAVSDWLYLFSKKVLKNKFKMPGNVDKVLKYFKYVYLVVLVVIFWNMDFAFLDSANPWNAFSSIFTVKRIPDIGSVVQNYTLGLLIMILLLAASLFVERFFCRYMCPLGAVFAIASKLKIIKIKKIRDHCGSCKACTNHCPMGIPMNQYDRISSGECIQCQRCSEVCPRNNATLSVADNNVNAIVVGTVAVAAISSVYYTGDALASSVNATAGQASAITSTAQGKYTDGTYEGSGKGFHNGTTKVSVTVENGNISDVEVLSYQDDEEFFNRAEATVVSEIIDNQSADVDAVSGATYSSNGIMQAVENALNNANNSSSSVATPATEITAQPESVVANTVTATPEATATSTPTTKSSVNSKATTKPTTEPTVKPTSTPKSTTKPTSTPKPTVKPTSTPTAKSSTSSSSSSGSTSSKYKDGTYQGSGTGFKGGTTTVSVTVSSGKISNISVVSYEDDGPFFQRAYSTVTSEIISSQSSDVDAVSGATYSSNGIMEAVADALTSAQQ